MLLIFSLGALLIFTGVKGHPIGEDTLPSKDWTKANFGLPGLVEGDLFLTEEQENKYIRFDLQTENDIQHGVKKEDSYKWPNNVVPFMISDDFQENEKNDIIRKAISDIEAATCVRFEEHFSAPKDFSYLHIIDGSGCWSYVGRVFKDPGQEQKLSIRRDSCQTVTIATHELVHALGVWHEQSRPDRDDYVTIHPENMYEGTEGNFAIKTDTWDRGSPYDPKSIMHYVRTAFSKNEKPTITWNDNPELELGGVVLSKEDIFQINSYYNCGSVTPSTSTTKTSTTTRPTTKSTTTTTTTKPTTKSTTTTTTTKPTTKSTTTTTTTTPTTKSTTTTTTTTPTTKSTTTTTTKMPTTKSTTITTTTEPDVGDCGDESFDCVYAHYHPGLCRRRKYKKMCRQTCGECEVDRELSCVNFIDKPSMSCYQRKEECKSWDYDVRYKMKTECTKTCCQTGRLYKRSS